MIINKIINVEEEIKKKKIGNQYPCIKKVLDTRDNKRNAYIQTKLNNMN